MAPPPSSDVSTELDTAVPRHQLLDNTAAKHRTELVHRYVYTYTRASQPRGALVHLTSVQS